MGSADTGAREPRDLVSAAKNAARRLLNEVALAAEDDPSDRFAADIRLVAETLLGVARPADVDIAELCRPVVEAYGAYWQKDTAYYRAAEALGLEPATEARCPSCFGDHGPDWKPEDGCLALPPEHRGDLSDHAGVGEARPQQSVEMPVAMENASVYWRKGEARTADPPVCEKCDGDGYVECWNKDHSDVVVTLCTDCGPAPGDFDG